ncbi:hypothetical protein K3495_g10632 [Podosphaera aphanis]|nr:hypothetical protein K3495_g10632 [Podosphaera aphanis]
MAAICTEIERANEVDDNRLDGYKVWFDEWTKQYFELLHPWLQRILRKQLEDRGIFWGHRNQKTTSILAELLTLFEMPEWPDHALTKWDNSLNPETRANKRTVELTASVQSQYRNKVNVAPSTTAEIGNEILMPMQESLPRLRQGTESSNFGTPSY